jgi:CRISPR-associated endonuclease/helicase Cas3
MNGEAIMISSNFFKSFDKIWEETPPIKDRLSEHQIYFAHLHSQKKPELLFEHTNTVAECFLKIMKAHHLETIVHQLIMPLLRSDIINSQEIVGKYIKKLFFQAIIFHDYGKVNENFQIEKMSNSHFHVKRKNKIGSTHSQLSAFLYIVEHLKEILESPEFDNETKSILYVLTFLFSNSITKHHAPYIENSLNFDEESVFAMKPYLEKYSIECDDDLLRIFFKLNNSDNDPHPIKSIINEIYRHYIQKQCNFPIYALVKLNYSLLTASDYYGTISYTLDLCVKDFGTLSIEDKEKFLHDFKQQESIIEIYSKKNNTILNFLTNHSMFALQKTLIFYVKNSLLKSLTQ